MRMGERNRYRVNFVSQNAVHGNEGTQLLEALQAINAVLVVDIPNLFLLARA